MERQPLIIDWARRACEVEDDVDGFLETKGLGEIVIDEDEVSAVLDVLDVLQRAGVEVVDAKDDVALGEQKVAEM